MARAGDRVEIHPALDLWMRGARYGDVVDVRRDGRLVVKLDRVKKPIVLRGEQDLFRNFSVA